LKNAPGYSFGPDYPFNVLWTAPTLDDRRGKWDVFDARQVPYQTVFSIHCDEASAPYDWSWERDVACDVCKRLNGIEKEKIPLEEIDATA